MTERKQVCKVSKKAFAFTSDTQRQGDTIPFIWTERMWACPATRQSWDLLRSEWSQWTDLLLHSVVECRGMSYNFITRVLLCLATWKYSRTTQCGKSFRHSNTVVENHMKRIVLSCHDEQSLFIQLVSRCCIWHNKYLYIHILLKWLQRFCMQLRKE